MCNAVAVLFLAQESHFCMRGRGRRDSQNGNNNVYCRDNPTGWVNWKKDEALRVVPGVCGADGSVSQGASVLAADMPKQLSDAKGTGVSRFVLSRRMRGFQNFPARDSLWACSTAGKRMAMEQRGRNSFMSAAIFTWVLPDWRFEASREEKVVSADGHRQRAGTVPKEEERVDAPRIELCGQSVVILTGK